MDSELTIGSTRTYIQDFAFDHLCPLPPEAAVPWVIQACPEARMGSNGSPASAMTLDGDTDTDARVNGWHNKRFVIVGHKSGRRIALVNQDGNFSIYIERANAA